MSSPDTTPYELDRAVASTLGDDGDRVVQMTHDWNTPLGTPNGGYVLAVVLQAMAEQSPLPDPLTASITYFRPTASGEGRVHVTTLRAGRRVATLSAALVQGDAVVVHAVASFHDADAAQDVHHVGHERPTYPDPDDCLDVMGAVPGGTVPILDRFDYRHESVPGWMSGEPTGDTAATFWVRPKDGRPVDALAAAVIVDAYPPVTAEIGHLKSATVQLTVHFRGRPAPGWVLSHVVTRHVTDGYHDEDVELWDSGGRLVAQSRQLALLS